MSPKNCMVAQSGGPTVAINASLAGVIDGVMRSDMYDTVYGSLNGITGILNNDLTNLSELMQQNSEYLDRLKVTPAMYLGSCRYKLPNYLDDDSSYVFIFKQFETYHIDAFFYIGGNDSMDTVLKPWKSTYYSAALHTLLQRLILMRLLLSVRKRLLSPRKVLPLPW